MRPIWLCYELGLEINVQTIDFSPAFRNSAEWRAISPGGKVPALTDADVTMVESGAMVTYILERYGEGRLQPAVGTAERALYHQWCWYAEATLSRPLGLNRIMRTGPDEGRALVEDGRDKAEQSLVVVEEALCDRSFLVGGVFTAADIMMGYTLTAVRAMGLLDDRPAATAYLNGLAARPAYQRLAA